jgi:hypothetical protein
MSAVHRFQLGLALSLICGLISVGSAQTGTIVKNGKVVPRSTILEFEIITNGSGAAANGQFWSRELAEEGYSVRVRSAQFDEAPGVTEKMTGRIRVVKVIGGLDRRGNLIFDKRQFSKNQVKKLAEWLRELKSFGAQGSPEGKPVWGLSQTQFESLFERLAGPIEANLTGKTLEECLRALPAPKQLPYRWSEAAKGQLKKFDDRLTFPEWQRIGGMAHGSGLAIVLRHFGFGFWPSRTPEGSIELVIEPITGGKKLWPLGWELTDSPGLVAPKFHKITEVNLLQAPLLDVAQAISQSTDTPVVFDTWNIAKVGINLAETKVDHPLRKRNWSVILTLCLSKHQLTHRLMEDEAGLGFSVVKPRDAVLNRIEQK